PTTTRSVALGAEPDPMPHASVGPVTQVRPQEAGYAGFEETARLWLDTAVSRRDLRPAIVTTFIQAVGHDQVKARVMVQLARGWAASGPGRRDVRDALFTRLLEPPWQRLLFVLWVRLCGRDLGTP
ncbi:hypothetical protein ACFQ07_01705, partial [Actinomadura adrarensis]